MTRLVEPGNVPGYHEIWRAKTKGSRPYVKPYPYARFGGRDSSGIVSGVKPWNGKQEIGAKRPQGIETTLSKISAGSYLGFVDKALFENQRNITKNAAIAKVHQDLTVANNLFESWYERKQSYDLLTNAAKELVIFAKGWKNPAYWKRFGKKVKQPATMPEAWLTYQFGIKPLVSTIDTALNHLAQPLLVAKVKGTSGFAYDWSSDSGSRSIQAYTLKQRFTYGCTIQPNPNPNMALANVVGLSMPFSTAWQVLPWGWAVDYFVNVSQLLTNLEVRHPGVFAHDWYLSTKTETTFNSRQELLYPHVDYYVRHDQTASLFTRTLISAPKYVVTYKFPLLGSNKVANLFSAIALSMKKG